MTTATQKPVLPKPPSVDVQAKSMEFHGRTVALRQPTPDQLMAWERLIRRIEGISEGVAEDEARKLWRQCLIVIDSVIAEDRDREWLEDRQLDGAVSVQDAVQLVVGAITAYEAEITGNVANRSARRAKA